MNWEDELFQELRGTEEVLPPAGGTPAALKPFEKGGRLIQPVWRRKDYLTDTWCHFNLARTSRPFGAPELAKAEDGFCYFCPGNEKFTPRDAGTGSDTISSGDGGWKMRAFPNLYPWLIRHGNIVESSQHKVSLRNIDTTEELAAFVAMQTFCRDYEASGLYPVIFKNQGFGASTPHTHWQYGALPYLPRRLKSELATANAFAEKWGKNIFAAIIDTERERGERFVYEDEFTACIVPYAPRSNYETWLITKTSAPSLASAAKKGIESLATVMTKLLRMLYHELGIDSLCIMVHQLALENNYRLHLEILPYKHWAGAERGFEEYVVEVTPEQAAEFLRAHWPMRDPASGI